MSYNIYILNVDDAAVPYEFLRAGLKGVQGNAAASDISFKKWSEFGLEAQASSLLLYVWLLFYIMEVNYYV